jgi:hypothetical protein
MVLRPLSIILPLMRVTVYPVETARPLEEPTSVADEPSIEDAQPATVPERNDTILEEPDDV